jgi:hypothetical protein
MRDADRMVIVPRGYEAYGMYLLERAAVHLDSLQGWYGVRPPVTRILLNPAQDLGGDMAIVQPLRIELSLAPAMDKGIRPQAGFFLDRVTGHELTHIVQFSTQSGLSKPVRWLFGDAVAPLGVSPDWQVEGQAIWTESQAGGGRLNSAWHRMVWRTPLLDEQDWSLDQIAHAGQVAPPVGRAYVAGAFLYDDLIKNHGGVDNASEWMRKQASWPALHSIAFRSAYDSPLRNVYSNFKDSWLKSWSSDHPGRTLSVNPVGQILASSPRTSYRSPLAVENGAVIARRESYDRPDELVMIDIESGR